MCAHQTACDAMRAVCDASVACSGSSSSRRCAPGVAQGVAASALANPLCAQRSQQARTPRLHRRSRHRRRRRPPPAARSDGRRRRRLSACDGCEREHLSVAAAARLHAPQRSWARETQRGGMCSSGARTQAPCGGSAAAAAASASHALRQPAPPAPHSTRHTTAAAALPFARRHASSSSGSRRRSRRHGARRRMQGAARRGAAHTQPRLRARAGATRAAATPPQRPLAQQTERRGALLLVCSASVRFVSAPASLAACCARESCTRA